jgi:hypothetical protein
MELFTNNSLRKHNYVQLIPIFYKISLRNCINRSKAVYHQNKSRGHNLYCITCISTPQKLIKVRNLQRKVKFQTYSIMYESLSQHDEKHVIPTPLSGIRVGGRV